MRLHRSALAALLAVASLPATVPGQGNPIVAENKKAGTTDWLLFNYDKVIAPGRDDLWKREKGVEGYCSHATVRGGETLKVFVSTEPPRPFKIDFYRMGYYGGKGARHMLSTGAIPGETQPTPADGPKAVIECKW